MTRRLLLATLIASTVLPGDTEEDVTKVVSKLAAALSAGNPQEFLSAFDRSMPSYQQLEHDLTALAGSTDFDCTIELIRNTGSDSQRQADLDWYMVLRSQQDQNLIERRRVKVILKLEKRGKKWLITGFTPLTLFQPMTAR